MYSFIFAGMYEFKELFELWCMVSYFYKNFP